VGRLALAERFSPTAPGLLAAQAPAQARAQRCQTLADRMPAFADLVAVRKQEAGRVPRRSLGSASTVSASRRSQIAVPVPRKQEAN
jgi:hypothetical protein